MSLSASSANSWQLSSSDQQLLDLALAEDLNLPFCDITTETLFADRDFAIVATIISKHPTSFVACGMPVVQGLLKYFPQCKLTTSFQDGDIIKPGATLLSLQGPVKALLQLERTLLNFLQHLSAVATMTQIFVEKIKHTHTKILDTRKTTPGFRHLDKYAVFCGGGVNHRMGLYDALLIKDNHIDALGGIAQVLQRLPVQKQYETVIEIRTVAELQEVLQNGLAKIDRVLLDNMNLTQLCECAELCKNKIATEASGNVALTTVADIAATGVDFVSVGKLTHSISAIDLSMRMG